MSLVRRLGAESTAAWHTFIRKRTAVFFTFFFPIMLVAIFGVIINTQVGGGGLFTQPPGYYIPGYLAVVVLFTPIERVGSTVARHRNDRRFEKLASTPLSPAEWLFAHMFVNVLLVGGASAIILGSVFIFTSAEIVLSPFVIAFVPLAVVLFCGIGAVLGRIAESQDGVIAAGNAIALPMLFLAETFVPPDMIPASIRPAINLLPLTYFSRGVRAVTYPGAGTRESALINLGILAVLAVLSFVIATYLIPWTES